MWPQLSLWMDGSYSVIFQERKDTYDNTVAVFQAITLGRRILRVFGEASLVGIRCSGSQRFGSSLSKGRLQRCRTHLPSVIPSSCPPSPLPLYWPSLMSVVAWLFWVLCDHISCPQQSSKAPWQLYLPIFQSDMSSCFLSYLVSKPLLK